MAAGRKKGHIHGSLAPPLPVLVWLMAGLFLLSEGLIANKGLSVIPNIPLCFDLDCQQAKLPTACCHTLDALFDNPGSEPIGPGI